MKLLIHFIGPRIQIQSACFDILSYAGVLFLPVITSSHFVVKLFGEVLKNGLWVLSYRLSPLVSIVSLLCSTP